MANGLSEADRRSRRRRRRLQAILIYTAIAIGLAWFFESQATTTIIFVRHAEKDLTQGSDDPGLSAAGKRRVAELTRQLVDADVVAGINAVYSTPFRRTQETAAPIAEALDLPVATYDPNDNDAVLDTILKNHKGKIILVVGHSNTLPALIADLGASKKVPPIDEDEYDNIYIVTIPWFGKTKTLRLRFGSPYVAAVADCDLQDGLDC